MQKEKNKKQKRQIEKVEKETVGLVIQLSRVVGSKTPFHVYQDLTLS